MQPGTGQPYAYAYAQPPAAVAYPTTTAPAANAVQYVPPAYVAPPPQSLPTAATGYNPGAGVQASLQPQNAALSAAASGSLASVEVTCPVIYAPIKSGKLRAGSAAWQPLTVTRLALRAECHISTAFVTVALECYLSESVSLVAGLPSAFVLPKLADLTVTSTLITNQKRDSLFATAVVPNESTEGYGSAAAQPLLQPRSAELELFQIALPDVRPGDSFHVACTWFQPLHFSDGQYTLQVPLTLPQQALQGGLAASIDCTVNTGTPDECKLHLPSHALAEVDRQAGRVQLAWPAGAPWPNTDFEVGYQVWSNAIVASVNVQPAQAAAPEPQGTFALAVSPPAPDATQAWVRSIVFVIDRSGSMSGEPIRLAREAIKSSLGALIPTDELAIIAFDHEQLTFGDGRLAEASPTTLDAAGAWCDQQLQARGGTDIMAPLCAALALLKTARGVPYVFLLTDGAVHNEREICRHVQKLSEAPHPSGVLQPRITTFAIGPYCNHFFLKQLAVLGRGASDVALNTGHIRQRMEHLLAAAARPVLTDVTLRVAGLRHCELYPFPIPDLFCGMPLLITGLYQGSWPQTVELAGRLPGGQAWTQVVATTAAAHIPLDKVFAKQRLDLLTASAWLHEDERLKAAVVSESVAVGVPCAHTTMVGFPITGAQYSAMQAQPGPPNPARFAKGGAAAVAILGGATVGLAFGSVAATVAGLSVFSAMDPGGLADLVSGDCCSLDCLGGADCGDCGCCGDAFSDVGGCLEGCCGGVAGCLGDSCSGVGDCLGGCVGGLGDCLGSGCAEFGGCLECCCSDACSGLGDLLGCLCSCFGEVLGSAFN